MSTHMFLLRNKKNINTFWLKNMPYLELCTGFPVFDNATNNPKEQIVWTIKKKLENLLLPCHILTEPDYWVQVPL